MSVSQMATKAPALLGTERMASEAGLPVRKEDVPELKELDHERPIAVLFLAANPDETLSLRRLRGALAGSAPEVAVTDVSPISAAAAVHAVRAFADARSPGERAIVVINARLRVTMRVQSDRVEISALFKVGPAAPLEKLRNLLERSAAAEHMVVLDGPCFVDAVAGIDNRRCFEMSIERAFKVESGRYAVIARAPSDPFPLSPRLGSSLQRFEQGERIEGASPDMLPLAAWVRSAGGADVVRGEAPLLFARGRALLSPVALRPLREGETRRWNEFDPSDDSIDAIRNAADALLDDIDKGLVLGGERKKRPVGGDWYVDAEIEKAARKEMGDDLGESSEADLDSSLDANLDALQAAVAPSRRADAESYIDEDPYVSSEPGAGDPEEERFQGVEHLDHRRALKRREAESGAAGDESEGAADEVDGAMERAVEALKAARGAFGDEEDGPPPPPAPARIGVPRHPAPLPAPQAAPGGGYELGEDHMPPPRVPIEPKPSARRSKSMFKDRRAAPDQDAPPRIGLGALYHDIPGRMKVGRPVEITIAISRDTSGAAAQGLRRQPVIHDVRVSAMMSVALRDPEDAFDIKPFSEPMQAIEHDLARAWGFFGRRLQEAADEVDADRVPDRAIWTWRVTPRLSGVHPLSIDAVCYLRGPDGFFTPAPAQNDRIRVAVAVNYGRETRKVASWAAVGLAGFLAVDYGVKPVLEAFNLSTQLEGAQRQLWGLRPPSSGVERVTLEPSGPSVPTSPPTEASLSPSQPIIPSAPAPAPEIADPTEIAPPQVAMPEQAISDLEAHETDLQDGAGRESGSADSGSPAGGLNQTLGAGAAEVQAAPEPASAETEEDVAAPEAEVSAPAGPARLPQPPMPDIDD